MNLQLTILDKKFTEIGKAVYYKPEYFLAYDTTCESISDQYFLVYDTLSITFQSSNNEFCDLDSFTNMEQWKQLETIALPPISRRGVLKILTWNIDDDRTSSRFNPVYEYSKNGILRIRLSDDNDEDCQFFQIGSDLIVGLRNQLLTSLLFTKLHIIEEKLSSEEYLHATNAL